jgi:hypothetical protein
MPGNSIEDIRSQVPSKGRSAALPPPPPAPFDLKLERGTTVELSFDDFEREVLAIRSDSLVKDIRRISKSIAASREWRKLFGDYRSSLWRMKHGDPEMAIMDMCNLVGERARESGLGSSIKAPIWYGRRFDFDEDDVPSPKDDLPRPSRYPNLRRTTDTPDPLPPVLTGTFGHSHILARISRLKLI